MKLVDIIPIKKTRNIDTLTYFAKSEVFPGNIVNIKIRNKESLGIVVSSKEAENVKSEIRGSSFEYKKLGAVKAKAFWNKEILLAIADIADQYATSIGPVMKHFMPKSIMDNIENLEKNISYSTENRKTENGEIFAIQGDTDDRMSAWKTILRQEFAKKRSILIYVPTKEDITFIRNTLSKGVEEYIYTISGETNPKHFLETYNKIKSESHPIVIISTPTFIDFPRSDIDTIILESENNRGWNTLQYPYIDMRYALEKIYGKLGKNIYLSDSLLRTSTLERVERHDISTGSPFKWKSISSARDMLIDMKIKKGDIVSNEEKGFKVISRELEDLIKRNQEENTRLFILVNRKGLATSTVCNDCEQIVSCDECGAPVVLHTSPNGRNFFMCHICGARRSADEMCKNCGGWRLAPLGIGTERVREEVLKLVNKENVFAVDGQFTKTEKQIKTAIDKFYGKPGSILIGTEMASMRLNEHIEHVAIASMDSLFSIPDWSIQERMMHVLINLRYIAKQTFLIQTRKSSERIFEYGSKGNLGEFFRTELKDRLSFNYPPYSVLIKLSVKGKKEKIANEMMVLKQLLAPKEISIFPAYTTADRSMSYIHGLIKIDRKDWPDMVFINKLKSLPPNIELRINPDNLL
jgi:primosomal protein N' (replication factor Y)